MISILTRKQKVMTLMDDKELFKAVNSALEQNGFWKPNDLDPFRICRLVFIDVDVLQRGFVKFLRRKFPNIHLVLVAWEGQIKEDCWQVGHLLDGRIEIPFTECHQAAEIVSAWVSRTEHLHLFLENFDLEFGEGLWASLIHSPVMLKAK